MSLKKQAVIGLGWTFGQQFGNQIIGFFISLILARILLPQEFGLIAMIAIFISVGQVLIESGLTQSLIRSHSVDEEDYATVFYFNILTSLILYLIVFFSGPLIADFYGQEILSNIIRLYSLIFVINALSVVQRTRLTKLMDFKTQTIILIPSTIIGGILGIILAYLGFGVWSLVWSQLLNSIACAIQFWIHSKWVPRFIFSKAKFKKHFHFGYKLTLSSLLNKSFNNIYLIIIGKFFSPAQLGYYSRAETLKQLPVNNVAGALNLVTYPLFVKLEDNNTHLKSIYKQLMQAVVFVISPALIIMGVLAEPIFRLLFTEKWLPAVPYFQVILLTGILNPVHSYNLNILKVKGRTDLFLKLAIFKKVLILLGIIVGLQFGLYGLLYGQVFLSLIFFGVNGYYTQMFIDYSLKEQILDIGPTLIVSIAAGIVVFFVDSLISPYSDFMRICIGAISGVLSFLALSYLFKFNALEELKKIIIAHDKRGE